MRSAGSWPPPVHRGLPGGSATHFEQLIQEITAGLRPPTPFPHTLKLEEQGLFAVGYYHQRQALFTRREKAARRSRPASALGLSGQVLDLATRSPTICSRAPKSSEAVPVHTVRVAIMARTAAATGSASITLPTASSRLPQ